MTFVKALAAAGLAAAVVTPATLGSLPASAEEIVVKMWSRADRSGPERPGNIKRAAELMNKKFAAAGIDKKITVEVFENNVKGFDADALDLLKAFAVGKGPDLYVAAHEWIGEFADAGYAMNMEEHIAANPEFYADIVPVLWESVKHQGTRFAIPQDTEIRMFFYNKDMLRQIGKSEEFIESLDDKAEAGEITIWEISELAKEVVDKGAAKYGIVHRPNVGPDYLMTFAAFGVKYMDETSGKLILPKKEMTEALKWFQWNAENGVTAPNNTSWSWDTVKKNWKTKQAFIYHHGIWNVREQVEEAFPNDAEGYFKQVGWMHVPPAEKGGKPANLSHPIIYVVNPNSPNKDLAAMLVGIASQPYYNTIHAVGSFHIGISHAQASMPDYKNHWALSAGTPMLEHTTFMPKHPKFGRYNAILFKGLQGVETGRLSPEEAVEFMADEMQTELGDDVMVVG